MTEDSPDVIRDALGICPICFVRVPSCLIEKNNQVFLKKVCPQHGPSDLLLSSAPLYYRNLDRMYFSVMDEDKEMGDVELYVTGRCNMRCSICYMSCNSDKNALIGEPSLAEIEQFIRHCKQQMIIIGGGEPTCREDLPEIIRLIRSLGKSVMMNTNGVRLAEMDYVLLLKKAGLQRVNIQFDGFSEEAEVQLRGANYLSEKFKAISNMNAAGMSVGLNMCLVPGLNNRSFGKVLDFIACHPHIVSVNFLTIAKLGAAAAYPDRDYLMPDQAADMFLDELGDKFSRENLFLFQKLHLAMKSFFRQRYCFYSVIYVGVRTKQGYAPLDAFLNFKHLDFWLTLYERFYKKSRILSKAAFILGVLSLFCSRRSWKIAGELLWLSIAYVARSGAYFRPTSFFYINFSTSCDPNKIDYRVSRNCHNEMAFACHVGDALEHHGRSGHVFIRREKVKQQGRAGALE
ncbi:MAG: radical SAM protein [Candidatus Omnitrophota bacterium]